MDTIDLKSRYDRFADALWFPTEHTMVLVGGCGGIGSWLSMFLARAGFTPAIYDFDIIEEHNIGGQLLKPTDVGKKKVSYIGDTIKQFTGEEQFHLFARKMLDYGKGNISVGSNLDTPEEEKVALTGLWFRMNDKIQRIKNLLMTDQKVNNEPLEDSFLDVSNYGIMATIVKNGKWGK